jgi:2-polyprenyl-3-methyl-5-hydroxy-6-metoxy-1,4-benzoquinol methylase
MSTSEHFDAAYYARFYEDPETLVYSAKDHEPLATYVFAFAAWNQIPISRVLDVGAGIGLWKNWITKNRPDVDDEGTEVSRVMCQRHGYRQCDITTWRSRKKYDLILCQGVLQYVPDAGLPDALENIAHMARGLFFLEALTHEDVELRADLERTDTNVHIREGSTYRRLLAKHFTTVGAGLYWPKAHPLPFWELDVGGRR